MPPEFREGDALIVVDVQRDFCPGGRLGVAGGDEVVPVLNRHLESATAAGIPIFASRDWHPRGHSRRRGNEPTKQRANDLREIFTWVEIFPN